MPTSKNPLNTAASVTNRLYCNASWVALILFGTGHSALQAANTPFILTEQKEASRQIDNDLTTILRDAGIERLYEDLSDNVLTESQQARQSCNDSPAYADTVQQFIGQLLNAQQLLDTNLAHISSLIEPIQLKEIADWMESPAGKQITVAESNSANWSDDEYAQRERLLTKNPDWNESRQRLVLRMVDASAITTFVAALHTETTALVLQAGDCAADEESRLELAKTISQTKNDETFFGFLLRNDIHKTAGMIFSDVSDADLEAYVAHSQSAAGQEWNAALLQSIRATLQDRHAPLQEFLTAID